jgi:NADH dehydrogenase/NADH:ubiquinone oxidoreductase 75 kD subunit (chain G)
MSDLHVTIDGQAVTVPGGTSVFDAARLNGIAIPTLCHQQNETPVGVCRLCVGRSGRPRFERFLRSAR